MDPDACLDRLVVALNIGDEGEIRAAACDLRAWLLTGAYLPDAFETFGLTRDGARFLLMTLSTRNRFIP